MIDSVWIGFILVFAYWLYFVIKNRQCLNYLGFYSKQEFWQKVQTEVKRREAQQENLFWAEIEKSPKLKERVKNRLAAEFGTGSFLTADKLFLILIQELEKE